MEKGNILDILIAVRGSSFVTFEAVTKPSLKAGHGLGKIVKVATVNGGIGMNYEAAVNRRLDKQGNEASFVAEAHKWAEGREGVFIVKGDKFYLGVQNPTSLAYAYFSPDGTEVEKDKVNPFLRSSSESSKEKQGLETPVVIRTYSVSNIRLFTWGGVQYQNTLFNPA